MDEWEQLSETAGVYRNTSCPVHEDALRLAEFFRCKPSDRILDIGTGNGILCVYACALYGGTYTGIDVSEDAVALAKRSAIRNDQHIAFFTLEASAAPAFFGHGCFDRILMNPPYFTSGNSGRNAVARHADEFLLNQWLASSFLLLKNGGTLCLSYPAEKLAELFSLLQNHRLMPKRMELLFSKKRARLLLVEAKKDGKYGLVITKG